MPDTNRSKLRLTQDQSPQERQALADLHTQQLGELTRFTLALRGIMGQFTERLDRHRPNHGEPGHAEWTRPYIALENCMDACDALSDMIAAQPELVEQSQETEAPRIGIESGKPIGYITRLKDGTYDDFSDGDVVRRHCWYGSIAEAYASLLEGTQPESGDAASIADRYDVLPIYLDPADDQERKVAPDDTAVEIASIMAELEAFSSAAHDIVHGSAMSLRERDAIIDPLESAQCALANILMHVAERASVEHRTPQSLSEIADGLAAMEARCNALPAPHAQDALAAIEAAYTALRKMPAL